MYSDISCELSENEKMKGLLRYKCMYCIYLSTVYTLCTICSMYRDIYCKLSENEKMKGLQHYKFMYRIYCMYCVYFMYCMYSVKGYIW